ncbi:MAG TPA: hypothetical protein VK804_02245 [Bradyrhizobium sp.]|jgi:hypothetical protein|uniref:hypothetical protein n=1 Tax=Bradyrhizobium sp. TaxID=376 RepID=UPI002CBB41D4|nr:hypothetical protein [Bradyrhizobium sp.]HTA99273.1 hypothetical protein [Bradyrhizobium sp.]
MRKLFTTKSIAAASVATLALLALIAGPSATAQTGTGSPGASPATGVREAPVGHRQPRAGDVPSEKNLANPNDPTNKEDAALDKKIKSICRGC